MNEKELNSGLRQLVSRGEIELKITDERVDCLLGQHLPESNERLGLTEGAANYTNSE